MRRCVAGWFSTRRYIPPGCNVAAAYVRQPGDGMQRCVVACFLPSEASLTGCNDIEYVHVIYFVCVLRVRRGAPACAPFPAIGRPCLRLGDHTGSPLHAVHKKYCITSVLNSIAVVRVLPLFSRGCKSELRIFNYNFFCIFKNLPVSLMRFYKSIQKNAAERNHI
jgi:hypothetical protein